MVIAIIAAAGSITAVTTSATAEKSMTNPAEEVVCHGYGDGHCTKCGTKNGKYVCKTFRPTNDHASECKCGHPKKTHAYN